MDHLESINVSELEKEEGERATHVIVGITYGFDAVLTVDREIELKVHAIECNEGKNGLMDWLMSPLDKLRGRNQSFSAQNGTKEPIDDAEDALVAFGVDQDNKYSTMSTLFRQVKKATGKAHMSVHYYGDARLDCIQNMEAPVTADHSLVIQEMYDKSQDEPVPKVLKLMPLSFFVQGKHNIPVHEVSSRHAEEIKRITQRFQNEKCKVISKVTSLERHTYLKAPVAFLEKLQCEISALEMRFQNELEEFLPKYREFGDTTHPLGKFIQDHRKRLQRIGMDNKLAGVDSCAKLLTQYHNKLEKLCPRNQNVVERHISLDLCFDYLMPGKNNVSSDECEIEEQVNIFEKIVHAQKKDECSVGYHFLTTAGKPAEIIFSYNGTSLTEIRPFIDTPFSACSDLEVQDGKINDPLTDVREAAKDTGSCRVFCKDMEMDTIVDNVQWDINGKALELKGLHPSGRYSLTFAVQNKGFWIPLNKEDIVLKILNRQGRCCPWPCSIL